MVQHIQAKSILNKTKRRDPWFLDDYTVNPYSGCSFNCLFCYIRGSKYGIHMNRKLSVKTNAVELLDKQLGNRAKKGQYGIIVLSSATDPYLQFEEESKLTRRLLEVILKHRFPVHIITRSDLVCRDIDLLKEINKRAVLPEDLSNKLSDSVFVTFSFSTVTDDIGRIFEPGATKPTERLRALRTISASGLLTGVSMMPLLPYITDTEEEMNKMVLAFEENGAQYVMPASLTLFGAGRADSKTLTINAIDRHFPELRKKYDALFQNGFRPSYEFAREVEGRARKIILKRHLRTSIIS